MIKLDHNRIRHTFSGRYLIDDGSEVNPIAGAQAGSASPGVPGFPVNNPSRGQNVVFSHSLMLSPRALNVARFTYLRSSSIFNEAIARDDPADFGFTYPVNAALGLALPEVSVGIYAPSGARLRQRDDRKVNNMFVWANSFFYEAGTHSLKVGGEFRLTQSDVSNASFNQGLFSFYWRCDGQWIRGLFTWRTVLIHSSRRR